MGEEGEYIIYTYHYTVTTRITCIKMGSIESHFNVSLIVRGKVTRQCRQTTTWRERRAEAVSNRGPSAYQPTALPLGQTGSQFDLVHLYCHMASQKEEYGMTQCPLT